MSCYHQQIAAALQAVSIRGPTQYAWLGRESRSVPRALDASLQPSERRRYLVSCLREELYSSFYCHGRPISALWGEPQPVAADYQLAQEISAANTGRGSWEPGWTVVHVEADDVVVTTQRLRTRAAARDCRTLSGDLRSGAAVYLRLPNALPAISPGFYTIVSDAIADTASSRRVVRVYWNIARAGAPALVRELTGRLNADGVPFRLKVLDHPVRFRRCDSAVLYLSGDVFPSLEATLRQVAADLTEHLRPQRPAFTLELTPGVGLAEDDGSGESFGVRRCGLLAEAIVRAHEENLLHLEARLAAVVRHFAEAGVSTDTPYLEPSLSGRHVLV